MHVSLNKNSNYKDFKTKEFKSKAQKPKALNLNNSLYPNPGGKAKTFNKARKEKKKYWRQEIREKKDSNLSTTAFEINTTSNSSEKKRIQIDLS